MSSHVNLHVTHVTPHVCMSSRMSACHLSVCGYEDRVMRAGGMLNAMAISDKFGGLFIPPTPLTRWRDNSTPYRVSALITSVLYHLTCDGIGGLHAPSSASKSASCANAHARGEPRKNGVLHTRLLLVRVSRSSSVALSPRSPVQSDTHSYASS
jgi:hypothetical protein